MDRKWFLHVTTREFSLFLSFCLYPWSLTAWSNCILFSKHTSWKDQNFLIWLVYGSCNVMFWILTCLLFGWFRVITCILRIFFAQDVTDFFLLETADKTKVAYNCIYLIVSWHSKEIKKENAWNDHRVIIFFKSVSSSLLHS